MKKSYKILLIVAAIFLVLGFLKDLIIKTTVEITASQVLGAPVHIGGMSVGIFKQSVRIKNLRIGNPSGFPAGNMADIPQIGVDYDLGTILKGELYLPLVIVNLEQMTVVKNKDGKLNVDALKVAQRKQGPDSSQMPMRIDTAILNLGKVVVEDHTKEPPTVKAFDIGVNNKTFRNINSAQQFATLVMVQSMGPTALKNAAIYGAASVLGVAFLPAGVAGILLSKDSAMHDFTSGFNHTYETALEIARKSGQIESEDKNKGVIKAKIDGANVVLEFIRNGDQTRLKISARKMLIPKPAIANGLMYQISQKVQ